MIYKTAREGNCSLKAWMQHNFDVIGNSLSFRQISATALLPGITRKQRNHTERCQKYVSLNIKYFHYYHYHYCHWKFFEFSTNICHSPASRNHTKTERCQKYVSLNIKYFHYYHCHQKFFDFRQISVTALLPEKNHAKKGNHTELSNVYFAQCQKYDKPSN